MNVQQITKITLAWELFNQGVPQTHIAERLSVNRDTVRLWIKGIKELTLFGFIDKYVVAKKGERAKRKVDGLLKTRIYKLREENRDCCGQKIKKFLSDEYEISLSHTSIYKILSEKYQLRSKWKKNQVRGPVPYAKSPREVIQMDTVDFGEVFAFTSVDIFTREVEVALYPSLTSLDGLNFLEYSFDKRYKHTNLLQADGGPEFKAQFRQNVFKFADRYRVSRPYKKNEQSFIESFNRSLRKECLGWAKYRRSEITNLNLELQNYLIWYHDKRPHMSLNMQTPNQFLKSLPDF